MRIPLTQADWPSAFNDISKQLGRNWPLGRLKLSQAQELTAKLFGYTSAFDVKQSLLASVELQRPSISEYAKSMSLRALVETGCRPDISYELFCELPWKVLEVCGEGDVAEPRRINKNRFSGLGLSASYMGHLLDLFVDPVVPPYLYAVKDGRLIYRREEFIRLMNTFVIQDNDLEQIGYMGTLSQFYREQFKSHIWEPIESVFGQDEDFFPLPYGVEIINKANGRYQLHNFGLQALYPDDFDIEQLKSAIITLFTGQTIYNSGIYESVTDLTKVTISDQEFYLSGSLKPYEMISKSKWLSGWMWPSMDKFKPMISKAVLDPSIEFNYERIGKWCDLCAEKKEESQNFKTIIEAGFDSMSNALKVMFGEERFTEERLSELDQPTIEDYMDCDELSYKEAQAVFNKELKERRSDGAEIREYLPELGGFFDDAVISVLFENCVEESISSGNDKKVFERRDDEYVLFLVYLTGIMLNASFNAHTWDRFLCSQLIADVIKKRINPADFKDELKAGLSMIELHNKQSRAIRHMKDYGSFIDNQDPAYLSHGQKPGCWL